MGTRQIFLAKFENVLDEQGVCKLPFIEESRLLSETAKVEHTLTVMLDIGNVILLPVHATLSP